MSTSTLEQDFLPGFPCSIGLTRTTATHADDVVSSLLKSTHEPTAIGISYHVNERGKVDFVALATCTSACLIKFAKPSQASKNGPFASLLSGSTIQTQHPSSSKRPPSPTTLVGFHMARAAIQINHVTQLAVKAVDLSSIFKKDKEKEQWPADIVNKQLSDAATSWDIARLWLGDDQSVGRDIPLQAWLAACVGSKHQSLLVASHRVDTDRLHFLERCCFGMMVSQVDILERNKPRESINDFSNAAFNKKGKFQIHNSRFMTRVRRSNQTQVVLEDVHGTQFTSNATWAEGKQTTLKFHNNRPTQAIHRIKVLGREEATNSERASYLLLYRVLVGVDKLPRSTFIRKIWFPRWPTVRPLHLPTPKPQIFQSVINEIKLNNSQRQAAQAMVGESPIVVVHGPPGTGKTTTIAASALVWDLSDQPTWIVAHSNVAVKNIAESLAKNRVDFKLLVSKEFYEEWHEHLYEGVVDRLIQSDRLGDDKVGIDRLILGSTIILSTLSMLSNPVLHESGFYKLVPLERLVIDEASQINIYEFLHVFHEHLNILRKVCFFGDPHQLPPFGKEEAPSLRTIFELDHVLKNAETVFLDTQYRMPNPIGGFISENVYQGRLNSVHEIKVPSCLAFVDASRTGEEKNGTSTRNTGEIDVIVNLIRHYYRRLNFCIITPYDAQRSAIQDALKRENLPWEHVFNVDSFQGNEAEYVLVSVVRSAQPGFLSSLNRMNVMLTRCKKGMVIVSNKGFLGKGGSGKSTLLGKLLKHWQVHHHSNAQPWIDWRLVSMGSVNLPGAPAPSPGGLLRTTVDSTSCSITDGMDALSINATTPISTTTTQSMPLASGSQSAQPSAVTTAGSSGPKKARKRKKVAASQQVVGQDGADR